MPRTGTQFYNQRKSGEGEKKVFVFLERTSGFHHQLLLQVEQGNILVPHVGTGIMVHKLLFLLFFNVCREHILGIMNLLSSLGRM